MIKKQLNKISSLYDLWVMTAIFVRGQFVCSQAIEIYLLLTNSLQSLLMVIHPTITQIKDFQINSSIDLIYTFIIRIEIYIFTNYQVKEELIYLFIFGLILISKLGFILLMFILKNHQHSDKFVQLIQHHLPLQIFIRIQSCYQQLLCPIFIIPFNTLILLSIKRSVSLIQAGQTLQYINLTLQIITFVLLQLDQIMICLINRQPITFKMRPMERSKVTESHLIIYIFSTISVILFALMETTQSIAILQCILVCFIQVVAIRNQFANSIYIYRYQEIILYSGHLFQLLFCILKFIENFTYTINYTFLLLNITPLILVYILQNVNQVKTQQFLVLFKSDNTPNIKEVMNVLICILNKCDIGDHYVVIRSSLINYFHSKQCLHKQCSCTTTFYIAEPRQANAITGQIFRNFIFEKISIIQKVINKKSSEFYCNQELLIQYAILLHDFGWTMLAAKAFNKILINDTVNPPINSNANQQFDKTNIQKYNKEMTIRSTTQLYRRLKSLDSQKEKDNANEMKLYFKITLGIIDRVRIIQLFNQTKWNMKASFGSSLQAAQQTFISDSINQYLNYEFIIQTVKQMIINLINSKVSFFSELIKAQKQFSLQKSLKQTNDLCSNLNETENYIKIQFEKYPSIRLQKALTFFLAELYSNYLEANKIYNYSINGDLKFIQNNHSALNLSQQQSAYVILSLNEDLKQLEVQTISNQMLNLIGKPNQLNTCFREILPLFFYQYHPLMVNNFLSTGKSRYYRNFSSNFVNCHDCLVKGIQLCYDTTSVFHHSQLVFVAFIQELVYEKCYIIVDGFDKSFVSLSFNFLQKIGYDDNLITKMVKHKYLNEISIYNIFPLFDEALQKKQEDNRFLVEKLFFFDYLKVRKSTMVEDKEKRMSNLNPIIWKQKEKVLSFIAKLNIFERNHQDFSYYVIEIQDIQQLSGQNNTFEDEIYEQESYISETSNISYSQNCIISQGNDDHPNQIYIQDLNNQASLFSPLTTMLNNNVDQSTRQLQTQMRETPQNQVIDNLLNQYEINESPLKIKRKQQQQTFYNCKFSHLLPYQDKSSIKSQEQNDDRQQQEEQDLHIHQQAQSQSSVASINQSLFYKKYELIEKITSQKPPLKINQFIGFLLIQNLIQMIYFIIILSQMPTDLDNSIVDINMIGLHSDVMAPHDLYFSMRITLSSYQQALSEGFINQTLFKQLTDPYYDNIYQGYLEFKDSLYTQLNNPYLQLFYNDYDMNIRFMKENETSVISKQMTFREVLLVVLQYQFAYAKKYATRESPSGSPFQVFLYANYFDLHDLLTQISDEIFVYSKERSNSVNQKWMIFWLISILIVILANMISFFYYNQYLVQYDKFLYLMDYLSLDRLENEITKLKLMLSQILHDEKMIFDYQFSFEYCQNKVQNGIGNNSQHKKNIKLKRVFKVSRLKPALILLFFCTIFVSYSTLVDQSNQSFFRKYLSTIDFFKLISDLKLRSGGVLMQKEIFYRWDNFTYLTDSDKQKLYILIDEALSIMNQYVLQVNSFDFDQLIVTQTFIDYQTNVLTENLCEVLADNYKAFMYNQCNLAFEGTLKEGTIQTLNYITNQVKAEQAINNFTHRLAYNLYEQEGSQVITRIFIQLNDQLSYGIEEITNVQLQFSKSLSIVYFVIALAGLLLIAKLLRQYLIFQQYLIKKIVNIIPLQILIEDESYERQLRLLLQQQEIV
ncbi:unnamed protein product (macronuclear) [Paramecium tetraurelia]|uniref:Transmembrane protein n=1 Tax=Paramecium tetraurelia TaxID=5888 RepID=A0BUD7_PARTE|nr:uncharacterized protein GSPATT00032386001 [Paramecium tetraurelia]CAK62154.1 unnamed protein product [Paramecium tetraurelia]|eukprot:XP_001429552.1 hypothetical protein (macronuclear) [Paramecium tetraurelia strain d4-2]